MQKALGAIVENSLNEIYIFRQRDLRFLMVNRGARQNLGYSMEELRALTPLELKPEYSPESFRALVAPLEQGRTEQIVFETIHLRKNRTTYPVEVHLQSHSVDSEPCFAAIILDITERKAAEEKVRLAEEELREKNRALEALNAELEHTLSHLNVIQGLIKTCANCKSIEDGTGRWTRFEEYIEERSSASFSHTVCPKCMEKLYGEGTSERLKQRSDSRRAKALEEDGQA